MGLPSGNADRIGRVLKKIDLVVADWDRDELLKLHCLPFPREQCSKCDD